METAILTGAGLAMPAGLNAYIPLLVLALADRATDRLTLHAPYDAISSNIGIALLVLLLSIEIAVDKVPGIDHVNDLIQTVVRPAAGVLVALASTSGVVSISPAIMVLIGLVLAGSVHAVNPLCRIKARVSPNAGVSVRWRAMHEGAANCCAKPGCSSPPAGSPELLPVPR